MSLLYVNFYIHLKNVLKKEIICMLHATAISWWVLMYC